MIHKYIALLRGINVSGQKKIKMVDLVQLLKGVRLQHVRTYIQSGNLLFQYDKDDKQQLSQIISDTIRKAYGFDVESLVITPDDLQSIKDNNPYLSDPVRDPSRIYYTFLIGPPEQERINILNKIGYPPEEFHIGEGVIYFYSPLGYGKAKMNNNFFEQKLKVSATTRNFKTVETLIDLVREL